jgi:zinc D-Ala-D-Ala carboxypeptidase
VTSARPFASGILPGRTAAAFFTRLPVARIPHHYRAVDFAPHDYAVRIAAELRALKLPASYAAERHLAPQPEATELVTARVLKDGRELKLTPTAAAAWAKMAEAAAADGLTLLLISGFRSVEHQRQIWERKLAAGTPLAEILTVNAAPGYSEHHTGRAVDIGTPGCPPLSEDFEHTPAFAWLARRAAGFGFRLSYPRDNPHGVTYEPWHWLHAG